MVGFFFKKKNSHLLFFLLVQFEHDSCCDEFNHTEFIIFTPITLFYKTIFSLRILIKWFNKNWFHVKKNICIYVFKAKVLFLWIDYCNIKTRKVYLFSIFLINLKLKLLFLFVIQYGFRIALLKSYYFTLIGETFSVITWKTILASYLCTQFSSCSTCLKINTNCDVFLNIRLYEVKTLYCIFRWNFIILVYRKVNQGMFLNNFLLS